MLTLLKARKIVDRALERAKRLNVSVSVAVCDTSGRLIALNQMDGSVGWEADRSSMGKAVAAAITGHPSSQLFEELGKGAARSPTCNNVVPPRGQRGGLPILEAGAIQGGCGVSGASTPEQDEECASAGIAASGSGTDESTYADRRACSMTTSAERCAPNTGRRSHDHFCDETATLDISSA